MYNICITFDAAKHKFINFRKLTLTQDFKLSGRLKCVHMGIRLHLCLFDCMFKCISVCKKRFVYLLFKYFCIFLYTHLLLVCMYMWTDKSLFASQNEKKWSKMLTYNLQWYEMDCDRFCTDDIKKTSETLIWIELKSI